MTETVVMMLFHLPLSSAPVSFFEKSLRHPLKHIVARLADAADDTDKVFFERHGATGRALVFVGDADAESQLVQRARSGEFALRDDGDVCAEPLDYLKHMRGEKDG